MHYPDPEAVAAAVAAVDAEDSVAAAAVVAAEAEETAAMPVAVVDLSVRHLAAVAADLVAGTSPGFQDFAAILVAAGFVATKPAACFAYYCCGVAAVVTAGFPVAAAHFVAVTAGLADSLVELAAIIAEVD